MLSVAFAGFGYGTPMCCSKPLPVGSTPIGSELPEPMQRLKHLLSPQGSPVAQFTVRAQMLYEPECAGNTCEVMPPAPEITAAEPSPKSHFTQAVALLSV